MFNLVQNLSHQIDVELGREHGEGRWTILIVFQAHYRIVINSLLFSLLYFFLPFFCR